MREDDDTDNEPMNTENEEFSEKKQRTGTGAVTESTSPSKK